MTVPASGRAFSRRGFLAGLALLPPALAACSAGAAEMIAAPVTPSPNPRLHSIWDRRPDGPLPPTGDEGVPIRAVLNGTSAQPSVSDGALVGNIGDHSGAVYVVQQLPSRLRTIGARFGFGHGTDSGSLCLAAWTGEPGTYTNCHMVVTPEHWTYSVTTDDRALIPLGDGPLTLPQDGRPLAVQVDLDGGPNATLHLPDGQVRTLIDARIANIPGALANWEFFKDATGAANVRLYETWAA